MRSPPQRNPNVSPEGAKDRPFTSLAALAEIQEAQTTSQRVVPRTRGRTSHLPFMVGPDCAEGLIEGLVEGLDG